MPSLRKHLSLFVILLILAGCGTTTRERNEKHRQEQATLARKDSLALKVAVTPTLDCLPLFVAVHTGIFDSLHVDVSLKEKNAQATDLLSDAKVKISLKRDEAVTVNVQGYSAVVLKFKA